MRFSRGRLLALATAAALTPATAQNTTADSSSAALRQSTFVTADQSLAFAITLAAPPSTDIYFALAIQSGFAWGAVGLGGPYMANALVLMIYPNAAGTNATFSPRLAPAAHREPAPYPALRVDPLPATGLANGTLLFAAVCRNCRVWPTGALDPAARAQGFAYALGPGGGGGGGSDDPAAPLRIHGDYGAFSADLVAATLAPGEPGRAPVLNATTTRASVGAVGLSANSGGRDWKAAFHAVIMIFCFVGMFPMGVLLIRLGEFVRWHAAHQTVALCGVLAGMGLGIDISLVYNRSKNFNNPHQIIGLIVVAALLVQFFLGFFHHRGHKKTKQPTKLAAPHVWLGRVAMVLGVINGFLGFPFALAPGYNYILAGLVLAVVPIMLFLLIWKTCFRRLLRKLSSSSSGGDGDAAENQAREQQDAPPRYEAEPWRTEGPQGGHGAGLSIGLSELRNDGSRMNGSGRDRRPDLGMAQTPREIV